MPQSPREQSAKPTDAPTTRPNSDAGKGDRMAPDRSTEAAEASRDGGIGQPVDSQWIRGVVDKFERPLTLYATRILGDSDLAMDVVQETFLRLCRQSIEKRQALLGHLAQWLYTVCRNGALNVRRKDSRMFAMPDTHMRITATLEPGPSDQLQTRETVIRALNALDKIPDNQRECIQLKFQHGMSYRQISAVTGLTTSYVGYLIHSGMKNLRDMLDVPQPPKRESKPRIRKASGKAKSKTNAETSKSSASTSTKASTKAPTKISTPADSTAGAVADSDSESMATSDMGKDGNS